MKEKAAKKQWVTPEIILISSASIIEKGVFLSKEGTVITVGQSLIAKNGNGQGYIGFPKNSFAS
jgi:hypothetical protein